MKVTTHICISTGVCCFYVGEYVNRRDTCMKAGRKGGRKRRRRSAERYTSMKGRGETGEVVHLPVSYTLLWEP